MSKKQKIWAFFELMNIVNSRFFVHSCLGMLQQNVAFVHINNVHLEKVSHNLSLKRLNALKLNQMLFQSWDFY